MSMNATATHPWPQFLGTLARVLRKVLPAVHLARTQDQQLQDLERLAFVSLHLLEDVGFQKDILRSNPSATCWRNGDMIVLTRSEPPCVLARSTPNSTSVLDQRFPRDAAVSPSLIVDHLIQNDLIPAEPNGVSVSREQVEAVTGQPEGLGSSGSEFSLVSRSTPAIHHPCPTLAEQCDLLPGTCEARFVPTVVEETNVAEIARSRAVSKRRVLGTDFQPGEE